MSGQILKIEEIEFTDKFCLEPKRRKDRTMPGVFG